MGQGLHRTSRRFDYIFLYRSLNRDPELDTGFFVREGILPTIKEVGFM
jgi:hypothetical protein